MYKDFITTVGAHKSLGIISHFRPDGDAIGSMFRGTLRESAPVGKFPAVVPLVTGRPYLTARCEFIREESDPFRDGFIID